MTDPNRGAPRTPAPRDPADAACIECEGCPTGLSRCIDQAPTPIDAALAAAPPSAAPPGEPEKLTSKASAPGRPVATSGTDAGCDGEGSR